MLARIFVDNYKCLVDFAFEPGRVRLILGENGTGKSTFFEVLMQLRAFVVDGVECRRAFPDESLTRWDDRPDQAFELTAEIDGGRYHYRLEVAHHERSQAPEVARESLRLDDRSLVDDRLGAAGREPHARYHSILRISSGDPAVGRFLAWFDSLCCVGPDPEIKPDDGRSLASPDPRFTEFAAWFRHRKASDPASIDALIVALKSGVIAGFEAIRLPDPDDGRHDLMVEIKAGDRPPLSYTIRELSEGQRVLIKLYALALCVMRPGSTLVLDDPVNHAALFEIQPWLLLLLDRADDIDAQVVLISHQPELIDYLGVERGTFFRREPDGPVSASPAEFDRDSGLYPSEQVARGWVDARA